MNNYIPSLHFASSEEKLTPEWCRKVIDHYYYNTSNKSLTDGKEVDEIEAYASGEFPMKPFERLFSSIKKSFLKDNKHLDLTTIDTEELDKKVQFSPLPLIPVKLNAAVSIVSKIPIECTVTALDALAAQKKQEDITFLQNKPTVEAQLQDITEQFQLDKVDLGTTKHSAIPYSETPYGIDISDPEDAELFANIVYQLGVESSLETAIQVFYELKKGKMLRKMVITDHYKFGVAVFNQDRDRMTGLPDAEYAHPKDVYTPASKLPDLSDNTHRYEIMSVTPVELMSMFPDEIADEDTLGDILNNKDGGYCKCNKIDRIDKANWSTQKIDLVKFQIRTVDSIGVVKRKGKRGFKYFVPSTDPRRTYNIWAQNTYQFYWLSGTRYSFDINKLDFAHRSKGNESFQNFTSNIYRSQTRSAVELSIKENKKAQIADIKLQYAILMSLPAGKYIDLKYFRNAVEGLTQDGDDSYTVETLLDLFLKKNIFVGDTEGFDGKHDGQFKPFADIAGGLKTEVNGYFETIRDAKKNIGDFTGINDELVGQSANPEGLVGLQKLLINGSLNSLYYTNEAVDHQFEVLFLMWGESIKEAIEEGGEAREAIVNMIGSRKVNIIDRLDEIPLHNMGIKVSTVQREEERARYNDRLGRLKQEGVISVGDEYTLDAIQNPKDKIALLAIKEKQYRKRKHKEAEDAMKHQQDLLAQQGQNQLQVQATKDEGAIKKVYAQADAQSKLEQLISQLGLQSTQMQFLTKRQLQDDRIAGQVNKAIKSLETKNNLEQQQPVS